MLVLGLTQRRNRNKIINEMHGYPFYNECFGEAVDFVNFLREREECTPKNTLALGRRVFGFEKHRSGARKDGGVQLAYACGHGGGYVYIVIPVSNENEIQVFVDVAHPDLAVIDVCRNFVYAFEFVYPCKEAEKKMVEVEA